jgi:type I restriction enzyme M protein
MNNAASLQPSLLSGFQTPKEIFRYLRNYLAGQFVGATRDETLLDEVLKCLFCKLYIETSKEDDLPLNKDSFEIAKAVRKIFAKVRADFPDIYSSDTEILLDPEAISVVIKQCDFSILEAGTDPIGDAFEVFVSSESRGQVGQFFTPQVVTDFLVKALNPKPDETIIDPACGAGGFLASVVRNFKKQGCSVKELTTLTNKNIFGVDKDDYLSKLGKLHISLLTKGHPQIVCGDSLSLQNGKKSLKEYFPENGFDVLFANPPFGTRIVAANPETLRSFQVAKKWMIDKETNLLKPTGQVQLKVPPQVLFVERCLSLLKEGGRLGVVLPESMLSNKSYRHVVQYIINNSTIQSVIGMPESLFKTSGKGGTHTKTCLLIAEKGIKNKSTVFMAEAKWCGHDSRARLIPHNDLPEIQENLVLFKKNKLKHTSRLGFVINAESISQNVLCPRYYDPELNNEINKLANTHEMVLFGDLVKQGVLTVSTGDELGKLAYGTGNIPFVRTSDISNWEIKADPKHGVDRKFYDSLRLKQNVQTHDLLMVKDGTYLIGTCALITENDKEIVYQSHLYKIRVNKNSINLNPFLLLAILTSPVVQKQVKAKQFTMDIIDSLGERINELILPIPKSKKHLEQITKLVESSVNKRLEARELAKEAQIKVAQI